MTLFFLFDFVSSASDNERRVGSLWEKKEMEMILFLKFDMTKKIVIVNKPKRQGEYLRQLCINLFM
jgi:hypothetical protein